MTVPPLWILRTRIHLDTGKVQSVICNDIQFDKELLKNGMI